jgi:membrane protein
MAPSRPPDPDISATARYGDPETGHLEQALERHLGLRGRSLDVLRRVVTGVWDDGFIHAGNLAYMTMLALFPFFIVMSAVFAALGEQGEQEASIHAFLTAMPRVVSQVLEPVARDVIHARQGWLLWAGGIVGLWTVSSLIETIRDIMRRAYGTQARKPFWRYRLLAGGIVMLAVVGLLASLYLQLLINAGRLVVIERLAPYVTHGLLLTQLPIARLIPAAVLFGSIYLLFFILTPERYRARAYLKWPGAALVTLWWGVVSTALPVGLRVLLKYDLTYGSLAGVMISLFFFWLVGLGMVTGAELNAALATSPGERDVIGQADDYARGRARGAEPGTTQGTDVQ